MSIRDRLKAKLEKSKINKNSQLICDIKGSDLQKKLAAISSLEPNVIKHAIFNLSDDSLDCWHLLFNIVDDDSLNLALDVVEKKTYVPLMRMVPTAIKNKSISLKTFERILKFCSFNNLLSVFSKNIPENLDLKFYEAIALTYAQNAYELNMYSYKILPINVMVMFQSIGSTVYATDYREDVLRSIFAGFAPWAEEATAIKRFQILALVQILVNDSKKSHPTVDTIYNFSQLIIK